MNWIKLGLVLAVLISPATYAQSLEGSDLYRVPDTLQLSSAPSTPPDTRPDFMPSPTLGADLYYVSSTGSVSRYIAGGILGTWIGLGLGHAVNGTWREIGKIFTYGEIIAVGSLTTGLFMTGPEFDGSDLGTAMFVNGLIVYGGLRLWEIVDVWLRPIIKGYVADSRTHRLALSPLIGPHTQGVGVTTSF